MVRFAPFHRTTDPETKPFPFTVKVNPAEPAFALEGESELNVARSADGVTVNVSALETTPLVLTVTFAVPADAISAADIAALNCVELMNVVGRFAPFHRTTEDPFTKPVPVTFSVKPEPPCAALPGDIDLSAAEAPVIVNVTLLETAPFELATCTAAVPAVAISEAGIVATSCVALWKVVVLLTPLQRTTDPLAKLLPVTVSVKDGPPVVALAGEMEAIFADADEGGGGGGGGCVPLFSWTIFAIDGTPMPFKMNRR